MAVFTPVAPETLADFMQAYDVGDITAIHEVPGGSENTIYRLETSHKGNVLFTLFEARTNSETLPDIAAFQQHLANHNLPVQQPLTRNDGKQIGELMDKAATAFPFMPGTVVEEHNRTQAFNVGEIIARMHEAAHDFNANLPATMPLDGLGKMLVKVQKETDSPINTVIATLVRELEFLEEEKPQLPTRIVHADLCYDNVLFEGNSVSGIIDFGFCCRETMLYDLALALNSFCFNGSDFLSDLFHAMLAGYRSVIAIDEEDEEDLIFELRRSAFRICVVRLYDSKFPPDGKPKANRNPMGWYRRLAFHQDKESLDDYR